MDYQDFSQSKSDMFQLTEEHYQAQATMYRSSKEYKKMKELYPLLSVLTESTKEDNLLG